MDIVVGIIIAGALLFFLSWIGSKLKPPKGKIPKSCCEK
jgi:hypothetical protein